MTDKLAAGGDVDEQPICALHRIFFTKRGEDCALCGTARRAGEGSQAAPPAKEFEKWWMHESVHGSIGVALDDFDLPQQVVITALAERAWMAAAAGSGTFAADFFNDVKLLNEFTEHWAECGESLLPAPCICGLEEIRQRIYKVMEEWHAQERLAQEKREPCEYCASANYHSARAGKHFSRVAQDAAVPCSEWPAPDEK